MKVTIELEIENCSDCPNYKYEGTAWSEDVYTCKKLNCEVNGKGIPSNCPFIESTMEKLRQLAVIERSEQLVCQESKLDCPYDFTSRCTLGRCDCKPKAN